MNERCSHQGCESIYTLSTLLRTLNEQLLQSLNELLQLMNELRAFNELLIMNQGCLQLMNEPYNQ